MAVKASLIASVFCVLLSACFNCDEWRNEAIAPMDWDGVVVAKEDLKKACTGRLVIQRTTLILDTIEGCNCGLTSDFWEAVAIGDHLLKTKGETELILSRADWKQAYDFPCCDY